MFLMMPLALATAEQSAPRTEVEADRISIVLAGGVTRGSYQAGQMWVVNRYLESVKRDHDTTSVSIVGSSAGGIVALVSAFELLHGACGDTLGEGETCEDPEDSLLFRAWVPMGLTTGVDSIDYHPAWYDPRCQARQKWVAPDKRGKGAGDDVPGHFICTDGALWGTPIDLTQSKDRDEQKVQIGLAKEGLISHAHFDLVLRGLEASTGVGSFTDVRLGLTATRLVPDEDGGGNTREVNEAFAFGISNPGGVRSQNVLQLKCAGAEGDWRQRCRPEDLTLEDGRELPFADMGWHIKPTSGIPVAFPIWEMPCDQFAITSLYPVASEGTEWRCWQDKERANWGIALIDGGTFDGNPMRLAEHLAKTITVPEDPTAEPATLEAATLEESEEEPSASPVPFDYLFMDPDTGVNQPTAPMPENSHAAARLWKLLNGIPTTARSQSLTQYRHEQGPTYSSMLIVPVETVPVAAYMGDFFGIFDRSFRVWDFYVGMHDAWVTLEEAHEEGSPLLDEPTAPLYEAINGPLEQMRSKLLAGERVSDDAWAETVDKAFDREDDAFEAALERAATTGLVTADHYNREWVGSERAREALLDREDYPAEQLRENLRTLTWVMGIRERDDARRARVEKKEAVQETLVEEGEVDEDALEPEPLTKPGKPDEAWFGAMLSRPQDCPECEDFRFVAVDLAGPDAKAPLPFETLLQQRLSWWAGRVVSDNLVSDMGVPLIAPMNLGRTVVMGHATQLSAYTGTPLAPGSMFTLGVGLDRYLLRTRHHLGFGLRGLVTAPPGLVQHLNGQCRDPLYSPGWRYSHDSPVCGAASQTLDARVMLSTSSPGFIGPLHGKVSLENAAFIRMSWDGLLLADSTLESHPYGEDNLWHEIDDFGHFSYGVEARVRLADVVSVSFYMLDFVPGGEDRAPLQLHALLSLTAPGRSLWTPRLNLPGLQSGVVWPVPPGRSHRQWHYRVSLTEGMQGRLLTEVWKYLDSDHWLAVGAYSVGNPRLGRPVHDTQASVGVGALLHASFATRTIVLLNDERGTRGFYASVSGGPNLLWVEGLDDEPHLGVESRLTLIGHEWAWNPLDNGVVVDLGVGAGMRVAWYGGDTYNDLKAVPTAPLDASASAERACRPR